MPRSAHQAASRRVALVVSRRRRAKVAIGSSAPGRGVAADRRDLGMRAARLLPPFHAVRTPGHLALQPARATWGMLRSHR
ncbi:hypothetical protein GCM10011320_35430 [Neoroseomonas lacus]|uniref:Uncharacterized protein n=1 Tax=Neoroseomonas lacus TaxID=287609 RepID=A0A917KRT5_9PROT|nr:hypothetical protein GCM10011320_35430 [Neoroseomonas lacus]